ncbi:MAG: hypothetical protein AAGI54_04145 [Planctomycetota bacterium]
MTAFRAMMAGGAEALGAVHGETVRVYDDDDTAVTDTAETLGTQVAGALIERRQRTTDRGVPVIQDVIRIPRGGLSSSPLEHGGIRYRADPDDAANTGKPIVDVTPLEGYWEVVTR